MSQAIFYPLLILILWSAYILRFDPGMSSVGETTLSFAMAVAIFYGFYFFLKRANFFENKRVLSAINFIIFAIFIILTLLSIKLIKLDSSFGGSGVLTLLGDIWNLIIIAVWPTSAFIYWRHLKEKSTPLLQETSQIEAPRWVKNIAWIFIIPFVFISGFVIIAFFEMAWRM